MASNTYKFIPAAIFMLTHSLTHTHTLCVCSISGAWCSWLADCSFSLTTISHNPPLTSRVTWSDCDNKFSFIGQVTHKAPHYMNRLQGLLDRISTDCITTTGPDLIFRLHLNKRPVYTLYLCSRTTNVQHSPGFLQLEHDVWMRGAGTHVWRAEDSLTWRFLRHIKTKPAGSSFILSVACIRVVSMFSSYSQQESKKTAKSDASIFHQDNPAFLAPTLPECHLPRASVRLAHFDRDIKWQDSRLNCDWGAWAAPAWTRMTNYSPYKSQWLQATSFTQT